MQFLCIAIGAIQLEEDSPPATNIGVLSEIFRGIHVTCLGKWAICLLIFKPLGSFSCHQELKDLSSLLLLFHQSRFAANALFSAPDILFQTFKANSLKLTQVYYGAFKSDVNHKFAEDKLLYIFNKLLFMFFNCALEFYTPSSKPDDLIIFYIHSTPLLCLHVYSSY